MPALELNNPSVYEVTSISHEMGRASTLKFYKLADRSDSTVLADRTEVKYTVNDVVWFHGKTLPARKATKAGVEVLEYTAADAMEFLGNNPCANDGLGVSEWYNRNSVDVTAYAWPSGRTVRQILEAELVSILGVGLPLAALDFTYAGAAANIVPTEFQTKGKTWLGLIDSLLNESPGLTYWYDPTTLDETFDPPTPGTLRFYDLSLAGLPGTRKTIVIPERSVQPTEIPVGGALWESGEIAEDISQSYDTVICRGWGDMRERYDKASPSWTPLTTGAVGNDAPYLREVVTPVPADPPYPAQPNKVTIQVFLPGPIPAGGQWVDEDDPAVAAAGFPPPWHPASTEADYKAVGRRFSVPLPIVDLRITRKDAGSPAVYVRDIQSMWTYSLQWVWYVGPLMWYTGGGTVYHSANFIAGIDYKTGEFSFGVVDDDGDVKPNVDVYGDPVTTTVPRLLLPTPIAYDSTAYTGSPSTAGGFLLKEPMMRRTNYSFLLPSSIPGGDYANMMGQDIFKYFPIYDHVYLRYTGSTTLEVEVSDLGLGYEKTLLLYDQRLLKYTDHTGTVIKDDTANLTAAANAIFALVSRRRVYGSATIHTDPASVMTDWPLGRLVEFLNWGGSGVTYSPDAAIQGVDLSRAKDEWRVTLKFDRAITFQPLERMIRGMEFFEGDAAVGNAGLEGKRGDRQNPNPKPKSKKPNDAGASSDPALAPNVSSTDNPTPPQTVFRGKITARSKARGTADSVNYTAKTLDGVYSTALNSVPTMRPFSDGDVIFAADIGDDCLIEVLPNATNTGYQVSLLATSERSTDQWLAGTVTARTASQSTPPGILYDWESEDGVYSGTGARPLYCPYNDAVLVDAAEVDPPSDCQILLRETSGEGSPAGPHTYAAYLWSVQEKIHFEVCETDSFLYNAGDGVLDTDAIVVTPGGEEVVTPDYEVVVSDVEGWTTGVEPRLVVGVDYRIVTDPSYNAVVEAQQTDVAGGYYDDLLVVANSNHVAVSTVGYSTIGAEVVPPTALD